MDIHKPHAPHSWGEFLREIGVIVCGVLIALSLEEVARWVHDRTAAAEARASIRAEIKANLDAMERRRATLPCVSRRIGEIGQLLSSNSGGPLLPAPQWVSQPATFVTYDERLQAQTAAGRIALLPETERAEIAQAYSEFAAFNRDVAADQQAWAQLRGLEHWNRPLSDPALVAFAGALQSARYELWALNLDIALAKQAGARLGLQPAPPGPVEALPHAICLPITTPRAEALRQLNDQGATYGQPE